MLHLDTNIVVAYLNGNQAVAKHLKDNLPDVAISALVLAELLYGARASARATENLERLRLFLQVVEVAHFDQASAEVYGRPRLALRLKGRPTGDVDILIASTAIAHDAMLITHNKKHFENINELQVEDWLA